MFEWDESLFFNPFFFFSVEFKKFFFDHVLFYSEVMDALSERRMSLRSHSQRLSSCDMNQSLYSTSSTASTASVPRKYSTDPVLYNYCTPAYLYCT